MKLTAAAARVQLLLRLPHTNLDGGDVKVLVEADGRRVSGVDRVQLSLHVLHILLKELHLQVGAGSHRFSLIKKKTEKKDRLQILR